MAAETDVDVTSVAVSLVKAAIEAAHPAKSIFRTLHVSSAREITCGSIKLRINRKVIVVAVGKAAAAMGLAIAEVISSNADSAGSLAGGIIVTKYGHVSASEHAAAAAHKLVIHEAAHPQPDINGYTAATAVMELIKGIDEDDIVLVAISGGGSALLPLPAEHLTLSDLQQLNDLLLRCGADIHEINTLRKHTSGISGGRLAAACRGQTVTLTLSDVIGDDACVIASGPTVADASTFADALAVIDNYSLRDDAPPNVIQYLLRGVAGEVPESPKILSSRHSYVVVGSNALALHACGDVLRGAGYVPLVLTTRLACEAKEAGRMLASIAFDALQGKGLASAVDSSARGLAVLCGGETTVTLPSTGVGKGGRNQELALSAALQLQSLKFDDACHVAVLSLGTDGTDGPTDAAGAICTEHTITVANKAEALRAMAQHDAYTFFASMPGVKVSDTESSRCAASGGLVLTGPTGTNVMDVMVLLLERI